MTASTATAISTAPTERRRTVPEALILEGGPAGAAATAGCAIGTLAEGAIVTGLPGPEGSEVATIDFESSGWMQTLAESVNGAAVSGYRVEKLAATWFGPPLAPA